MSEREVVNRLALEDRDEKYMTEVVAALVAKLAEGRNYVNAQQFADLVVWFQDDLDADEAMETGRFEIYDYVQVVRVKPPVAMTVTEIATKTGLPWSTVKDLVTAAGLKGEGEGRKKYYNIGDLAPLLNLVTKRREE